MSVSADDHDDGFFSRKPLEAGNIARDPTVAAYLQRFPEEDQDRALRDRIIVKLGHWAVEDWPARLGRLSGGVFFGNDPSF